jgi:hypothetical protein
MLSSMSFANIVPWVSNTPGTNSPIGEMTTQAKTFSREMGIYQDNTRPNFSINCLRSIDETEGVVTKVVLDSALAVQQGDVHERSAVSGCLAHRAGSLGGNHVECHERAVGPYGTIHEHQQFDRLDGRMGVLHGLRKCW